MDAFGTGDEIRVLDWGFTKDDRSHELVELMLGAAGSAALKYVVVPGLKLLGEKLIELGAETAAAEVVKAVVSRLRPKQEAQAINDFYIGLPDGTRVQVMPPDRGGAAEIWAKDGTRITVDFASRGT